MQETLLKHVTRNRIRNLQLFSKLLDRIPITEFAFFFSDTWHRLCTLCAITLTYAHVTRARINDIIRDIVRWFVHRLSQDKQSFTINAIKHGKKMKMMKSLFLFLPSCHAQHYTSIRWCL